MFSVIYLYTRARRVMGREGLPPTSPPPFLDYSWTTISARTWGDSAKNVSYISCSPNLPAKMIAQEVERNERARHSVKAPKVSVRGFLPSTHTHTHTTHTHTHTPCLSSNMWLVPDNKRSEGQFLWSNWTTQNQVWWECYRSVYVPM